MRILKFVDAATTDEHYFPVGVIVAVEVTDNNTVKVFANLSGELTNDVVELTCTGTTNATAVAEKVCEYLYAGGIGYQGIKEIKAGTGDFALVTAISHSAGS